jgi:hypothetical protein
VPGSSEREENRSGARNSSSVLSTSARAAECRSEPGVDYKSATAKRRDYRHGTPAYRDSRVAEADKNGHRLSDCHCSSEAVRCAGRRHSRRNRNGQPRRAGPGGACVRIRGAGSRDDSTRRIPSARGLDPLHCPALPRFASSFRDAGTRCCPSKKAAGFATNRAAAESFRLPRERSPGGHGFEKNRVPRHPHPHGDRPSRRYLPDG